jgi:hypothetical protein
MATKTKTKTPKVPTCPAEWFAIVEPLAGEFVRSMLLDDADRFTDGSPALAVMELPICDVAFDARLAEQQEDDPAATARGFVFFGFDAGYAFGLAVGLQLRHLSAGGSRHV